MTKRRKGWGKAYTVWDPTIISELLIPHAQTAGCLEDSKTYGEAAEDKEDALWLSYYKKLNKRRMNKSPKIENCTSNKRTGKGAVAAKMKNEV